MLLRPEYRDNILMGYLVKCPACLSMKHNTGFHLYDIHPSSHPKGGIWQFNGDFEKPTFAPSFLLRTQWWKPEGEKYEPFVCHSFLTDGKFSFLTDCNHHNFGGENFAGVDNVPMIHWEESEL